MQAVVVCLFDLVPVAVVLLQARLLDAVATALPLVTVDTLKAILGTGFTGAGAMYLADGLCTVLGGISVIITIPLYTRYRHARD